MATKPNTSSAHTPAPWTLGEFGSINAKLPSGKTVQVTYMSPTRFTGKDETKEAIEFMNQTEANARHIVHCVNMHDELLDAAKRALWKLEMLRVEKGIEKGEAYESLETSIAKAEGRA